MAVAVSRSRICMFGCKSRVGCILFFLACILGSIGLIVFNEQPAGCDIDTACGWILYISGGGAFAALTIYELLKASRKEKDVGVARGLIRAQETRRERGNLEMVESLQLQLDKMIEHNELDNETIAHIRGEVLVQRQEQQQQRREQQRHVQQDQYHRHQQVQEQEQEQQEGYVHESEVQMINMESQSQSQFQPLNRDVRPPPTRWSGYVTITPTSISDVPSPPCHAPTLISLQLTCHDGIISGTGTGIEIGTESRITGSYDVMTGRITFTQQVLSLSSSETDTVYVGRFITSSHIAGTCSSQTSNGTFMLQTPSSS